MATIMRKAGTVSKAVSSMVVVALFSAFFIAFVLFMLHYLRIGEQARINELLLEPEKVGWSDGFVEVYNPSDKPLSVEGWSIRTKSGSKMLFGEIKPKGYVTVYGEIADSDGDVVLADSRGLVVDSYSAMQRNGVSVGRYPDGAGGWTWFQSPTPGRPNMEGAGNATPQSADCPRDEYLNAGGEDPDGFCAEFERQMKDVGPVQRERIAAVDDPRLRADIAFEVGDRERARGREERGSALVVSDDELMSGLRPIVAGDEDDILSLGLSGEFMEMSRKFRGMLYDLATGGTDEEKARMGRQLRDYLGSRDANANKSLRLDPDAARGMMEAGGNASLCGRTEYSLC
jgi:hypothetical protein